MKIEAGKYYRTRDGQKVGPMVKQIGPYAYKDGSGFVTYTEEGRRYQQFEDIWDVVSEWTDAPDLTAITTPFGLLDDATREALKAHPGPFEWWHGVGWFTSERRPAWDVHFVYRVKPQPTAQREWWITGGNCIWDTYADAQNACDPGEKPVKVREVT